MAEFSVESVLEELTPIFRGEATAPSKPYSYFARAIRAGRKNLENDRIIVREMEKYSTVLSKHTVLDDVFVFEEEWKKRFPQISVASRDMAMIYMSKHFVADFSVESTGTGGEIGEAYHFKKPMILFCREESKKRPTMIRCFVESGKGIVHYSTPSFEEILKSWGARIPIFYYNNQSIEEIAEREIRNLFTRY